MIYHIKMMSYRSPIRVLLAAILFLLAQESVVSAAPAVSDPFPVYPSIRENVAFWQDIYGKYHSTQGLIHDNRDLSVVYEVIRFENTWEHGARKRNRDRIKKAKQKYKKILAHLAKGKPRNDEERRVAALFGPTAKPADFREARENIRFQLGQKDIFETGLVRSGYYLDQIKEILTKHGVPEDLAYLPHVESSFNYKAYSKFGAAGIWQFTRSTGKQFMTVDYALDERRDPIRATQAAARLLKQNYQKLGNWPMAITAYNHGVNGMLRAREAKGDYEAVFNEYDGRLFKFASRNFYSEFLAAREVAENYRRYFGPLRFAAPIRGHEVELPGYAHVDELVRHLKVDMQTFKELNPGLREPVYSGQKYIPKGYRVRLPVQKKVMALAANIPADILKEGQKRSSFYVVRRGDTAGIIARRHGIKLGELILANQLDSRATIYAGQNLRIPQADERVVQLASVAKKKVEPQPKLLAGMLPTVTLPLAEKKVAEPEPQTMVAQEQVAVVAVAQEEAAEVPETVEVRPEYTVPEGLVMAQVHLAGAPGEGYEVAAEDEPPRLAMRLSHGGEEEDAPAESNMLIPAVNPAVVMGHLQVEKVLEVQGQTVGIIRVEAEETLGHYAEWLNLRAWDIRRLNGFNYRRAIMVDQVIKIPLHRVNREQFEEKRYEYHKEMEEDFFAAYKVEGLRSYRVKSGDNIWALCRNEFEIPFWLVRKYNATLDFNLLKPDQTLIVPLVESSS